MFRTAWRWVLLSATVMLACGSPCLTIYFKLHSDSSHQPNWFVVYSIVGAMLLLTAFLAFQTYINPLRDIRSFADDVLKAYAMRIAASAATSTYGGQIQIRVGLLMLHRPVSRLFLRRHFRVEWQYGMNKQPDLNVTFHCRKGVCGAVVSSGVPHVVDMTDVTDQRNRNNWGFRPGEMKVFPKFTCIASWPVYKLNKQGRSGAIVGALNFDSVTPHAYATMNADPVLQAEMMALGDLFCKLVS